MRRDGWQDASDRYLIRYKATQALARVAHADTMLREAGGAGDPEARQWWAVRAIELGKAEDAISQLGETVYHGGWMARVNANGRLTRYRVDQAHYLGRPAS